MKNIIFISTLLMIVLLLISAGTIFNKKPTAGTLYEQHEIISCGYPDVDIPADANGKFIIILPGLGHHTYDISTNNDSTQIYFNQGLNFYYSYHLREALASFKEAARFDSTCGMAFWGQALSMGPYYNAYYYKMKKDIPNVLKSINKLLSTASGKEKDLMIAMQKRYSRDTSNADRVQLDSNYAAAMHLLIAKYPKDNDIKALYIDAVMLEHKWDFWYNNGYEKAWTPELMKLCESIFNKDSLHPAALHYYIHITEASKHPELALHSANILKDAMPGAGHMVHMATHMYQRNGLFAKGVHVNEDANNVNNHEDSMAPNLGIGQNKLLHIYAVQSYCAMNAGMFNKGMPVYFRARTRLVIMRNDIDQDAYSQYVYMMPVIAWVRLGKWDEISKSPLPDVKWVYASILGEFARGLAAVHNKDYPLAGECLDKISTHLDDSLLNIREMPFNKPVQSARIARGILKGELLFGLGKTGEAIAALRAAVAEEDNLIYREPQEWLIPARQYLGAFLLKMNKAKEAEKVYREDLVSNPNNGWSLTGMYNSLMVQNKTREASKYKAAYIKAFKEADVNPVNSVF